MLSVSYGAKVAMILVIMNTITRFYISSDSSCTRSSSSSRSRSSSSSSSSSRRRNTLIAIVILKGQIRISKMIDIIMHIREFSIMIGILNLMNC